MPPNWIPRGACAAAALFAALPAYGATDAEVAELRRQLLLLTERLNELEARQAETADRQEATEAKVEETADRQEATEAKVDETAEAVDENTFVKAGRKPGTFIFPGTDTEVELSGYVKGDFIYDVNEDAGGFAFNAAAISTDDLNDNDRFTAHARQSRFTVKTRTPTEDFGDVKTLLEADFFNLEGTEVLTNSAGFRLRHAYGEIGPFGVGQFWTNFMPLESYPRTVDFNGPTGIPFIRQAQIRYTTQLDDDTRLSLALENSEFSGFAVDINDVDGDGSTTDILSTIETGPFGVEAGVDVAPDLTAALRYRHKHGHVRVAGVARVLSSPTSGDEEIGWGLNLAGNLRPWDGGLLRASFSYGDGLGRYTINGPGDDGFVDATGNLRTIESYGATLQFEQRLTETLSAAVAYGRYESFDTFTPGDLEALNTVHTSLFYKPYKNVTAGAEAIWGYRKDADGSRDDALRLQTSLQVNF